MSGEDFLIWNWFRKPGNKGSARGQDEDYRVQQNSGCFGITRQDYPTNPPSWHLGNKEGAKTRQGEDENPRLGGWVAALFGKKDKTKRQQQRQEVLQQTHKIEYEMFSQNCMGDNGNLKALSAFIGSPSMSPCSDSPVTSTSSRMSHDRLPDAQRRSKRDQHVCTNPMFAAETAHQEDELQQQLRDCQSRKSHTRPSTSRPSYSQPSLSQAAVDPAVAGMLNAAHDVLTYCLGQCETASDILDALQAAEQAIKDNVPGVDLLYYTTPQEPNITPSLKAAAKYDATQPAADVVLRGWLGLDTNEPAYPLEAMLEAHMPEAWREIEQKLHCYQPEPPRGSNQRLQDAPKCIPDLAQLLLAVPLIRAAHIIEAARLDARKSAVLLVSTARISTPGRASAQHVFEDVAKKLSALLERLDSSVNYIRGLEKVLGRQLHLQPGKFTPHILESYRFQFPPIWQHLLKGSEA